MAILCICFCGHVLSAHIAADGYGMCAYSLLIPTFWSDVFPQGMCTYVRTICRGSPIVMLLKESLGYWRWAVAVGGEFVALPILWSGGSRVMQIALIMYF